MRATVILSLLLCAAIVLIATVPTINRWERAQSYPFGRMCDSVFTGWENSCPL